MRDGGRRSDISRATAFYHTSCLSNGQSTHSHTLWSAQCLLPLVFLRSDSDGQTVFQEMRVFVRMQLFLLLLFLLAHVAVVMAVAGCHSDRDKDHRPRENCTAAGFSDIPAGIELTTKVLLFPSNLFSSLSWSSFQIFTQIYEIDLTGNKVPEVTPSVSSILPSLSVLRLGSNQIKSLSDGSFSACPALTELYLVNNAIHTLSDSTFSGLSKLEILDLSSNRIKVLPDLMLHPLPAIETLYLENNMIRVMPDNWFSQKEDVPYLYLSANPWACFCSLGYLRRYLEDYEYNVYVRDGPIINSDAESVVCDSPQVFHSKPVLSLEESDLCSATTVLAPPGDFYQPVPTAAATPLTSIIPFLSPPITTSPTEAPPTTTSPAQAPPTTTSPTQAPPTTTFPTQAPPTRTSTQTPAHTHTASQHFVEKLHTEYYTWSWSQTFTRLFEWSDHSGSVGTSRMPLVELRTVTNPPTPPTIRPLTKSPVHLTTVEPRESARITSSVPTEKFLEDTRTTTRRPWVYDEPADGQRRRKIRAVAGAGVFCTWLFAACLLLCVASAMCILATLARLVIWYRRVYKPLSAMLRRRGGGADTVRLVTYNRRAGEEAGVMALYRSVLFIHREGGEAMQKECGGREEEGEGGKERLRINLEPTRGRRGGETRGEEGEGGEREERGVYRKTMYRLLSKEEEVEGWRDVMEECVLSAGDRGRRGGGDSDEGMDRERSEGGVSRKRYSVILREERETGVGKEEQDWVVGGWEVKREGGGEEERAGPRSSWGEWLVRYLPSMPWQVATPPEGEAAQ